MTKGRSAFPAGGFKGVQATSRKGLCSWFFYLIVFPVGFAVVGDFSSLLSGMSVAAVVRVMRHFIVTDDSMKSYDSPKSCYNVLQ